MRPDAAKQNATQQEGAKDEAKDLENLRQPESAARREQDERGRDETARGRVRGQDPNFGRGHH
ncbi:MAG TPA: hypothetical protein VEY50_01485 [Lysobacter sp.]|nr:hypothetical protein [Lysobacter sp.]